VCVCSTVHSAWSGPPSFWKEKHNGILENEELAVIKPCIRAH
jgi:hypothetical protein